MRILITGATGFIGSRLALRARELEHEVIATGLVRTGAESANRQRLAAAGIEVLATDLETLANTPAAWRGIDVVIHLAAAQHEMNVPDAHFRKVNVEGTRRLLDVARQVGAFFLYGSTIGVYGARDGLLDESTSTGPDNIYGQTKLEAERVVLAQAGEQRVAVIRITETYGPGDQRLLKLFKAIKNGRFVVVGNGRNLHHPIYIDDLVELLLLAASSEAAAGQVILSAGKEAVTTNRMIKAISAAVARHPPRLRIPLTPVAAAAFMLETTLRPLGIQPPLHRRRLDFFRKSFRLHSSKAHQLLGFIPKVGFDEGALRAACWYEHVGEL
jgi:nucleoside-diphosphate-sugar epimerase